MRRGTCASPFSSVGPQTDPTAPPPPMELTPLRTSAPAPFKASFKYGRENEGLRCFPGDTGDCGGDLDKGEADIEGKADGGGGDADTATPEGRGRVDDEGGIGKGRAFPVPFGLAVSAPLSNGEY
jgi:hypothetical protein